LPPKSVPLLEPLAEPLDDVPLELLAPLLLLVSPLSSPLPM
jgi:hypothetical protein